MVERQLHACAIHNPRVLEAVTRVPREVFVPGAHQSLAFADCKVPLPCGQHMMTPRNEGLLLQALDLQPGERVLEIGTGSGFLTACMAALGAQVDSLEYYEELAQAASTCLQAQQTSNVQVLTVNAWQPPPAPPYDVVVLTASLAHYNSHFEQWLTDEGRLFAVVGEAPVMQAQLIRQNAPGQLLGHRLFELELDPLLPPD